MPEQRPRYRLEHAVHWALFGGLSASTALLTCGLAGALIHGGPRPEGPPPPFVDILRGAARGEPVALMGLGLLLLIATPVLRVAVLAVGWSLERNRRFAAVACAVLALLVVSFLLGSV